MPIAVDVHAHFREPTQKNPSETFQTGSYAAAFGGYGVAVDMPNTPGNETWAENNAVVKRGIVNQHSAIAMGIHAGSQPESDNIGELQGLARHSLGLKLYGTFTTGNERDKDYEAKDFTEIVDEWHRVAPEKPILVHAGEDNLDDFVNLIAGASRGHRMHLCHVNRPSDAIKIFRYKREGYPVTSGVTPHHLLKTSYDEISEGWFARMMPHLAHQDDADQLITFLNDEMIDIVETDHAPHPITNKWQAESDNPEGIKEVGQTTCYGVPGAEFSLPLQFRLAQIGRLSLSRIIDANSNKPAKLLGINISPNSRVTWDLKPYRIGEADVKSGARWTPFMGKIAVGRVINMTVGMHAPIQNGNFNPRQSSRMFVETGAIV